MRNFGTLYGYELRKILCRKLTVIVLAAMFLLNLGLNAAEFVASSKLVSDADSGLVGRELDDTLLEEMRQGMEVQTATGENGEIIITSAKVIDPAYSHLWKYLKMIGGNDSKAYNMTAEKLTDIFDGVIRSAMDSQKLTDSERAYWDALRAEQPTLPQYGREGGWGNALVNLYMMNFLIVITIAATLSGIFSDEYTLRTDALVFSSNNGKKRLSRVKLLAGMTVGFLEAVFMIAESSAIQFIVYGGVDFKTSVQFYYGPSAMDLTAGQSLLICVGILLLMSLLYSALTMYLSQLVRNATIPMGAMALLLILSMLNPPERFRLLSQLSGYMPATFPGNWTFTDYRLVTLFGHPFTILQMMPILYVLLTALLAVALCRNYRRVQIGGR